MSKPTIGSCLSYGLEVLKKDPVYVILGFLVAVVIGMIPFGLLVGPMLVGWLMGVAKLEEGGKPRLGDIFQGLQKLVPALIVALLGGIAVGIGFVLLIIPGLIIMPIPLIGLIQVARGADDGIAALKQAWGLYKNGLVPNAVSMVVIQIVGSLPLISLITAPIAVIGQTRYVANLREQADASTPADPAPQAA
ncbi:MAG: hypothetical protein ACOCXJ_00020 [Planctomycetota bacterium]